MRKSYKCQIHLILSKNISSAIQLSVFWAFSREGGEHEEIRRNTQAIRRKCPSKNTPSKTLAPPAKRRESEFPSTEGLNASENIML